MRTIWKQPLVGQGRQEYLLPCTAQIIHVEAQQGNPCIWYLCDTSEQPKVLRTFLVVATGGEVPDNFTFLGTALLMDGRFVLHVFEERSAMETNRP